MSTVSDMLGYGLIVTLVGMSMCFIILIGLAYMLDALKMLSNKGAVEKKTEIIKTDKTEEIAEPVDVNTEDEGELIAVISAALAAFIGSSSPLVIKSIKRAEDNTPAWAKVGRHEQMLNRL